jgi:hypothetical protein
MIQIDITGGGNDGYGSGIGQEFGLSVTNATLTFDILVTSGQVTAGLLSNGSSFFPGAQTFYASPNWQQFSEQYSGSSDRVYLETLTTAPSNDEFFVDNVVASIFGSTTNLLLDGGFDTPAVGVPGPIVGTGLPSLVLAIGLLAWNRRKMSHARLVA